MRVKKSEGEKVSEVTVLSKDDSSERQVFGKIPEV